MPRILESADARRSALIQSPGTGPTKGPLQGHDKHPGDAPERTWRTTMADRREENYRHAVAFVTHTREYASAELLPALARHGYTTTERPHDRETERLVTQFEP